MVPAFMPAPSLPGHANGRRRRRLQGQDRRNHGPDRGRAHPLHRHLRGQPRFPAAQPDPDPVTAARRIRPRARGTSRGHHAVPGYNRRVTRRCGGQLRGRRTGSSKGVCVEQAEEGRLAKAPSQGQEARREAPHVDARSASVTDASPALLLAVVDDLFVRSRIDAAAGVAGVEVRYVGSIDDARAAVQDRPARALLVGMAATRRRLQKSGAANPGRSQPAASTSWRSGRTRTSNCGPRRSKRGGPGGRQLGVHPAPPDAARDANRRRPGRRGLTAGHHGVCAFRKLRTWRTASVTCSVFSFQG